MNFREALPQAINEAVVLLWRMWCANDTSALQIHNTIDTHASRRRHGVDLLHMRVSAFRAQLCIAMEFSILPVERTNRICIIHVTNPAAVVAFVVSMRDSSCRGAARGVVRWRSRAPWNDALDA